MDALSLGHRKAEATLVCVPFYDPWSSEGIFIPFLAHFWPVSVLVNFLHYMVRYVSFQVRGRKMPNLVERSLIRFGDGGLVVCIPKAWATYYGLKPGDKVFVVTNGELRVKLKPKACKAGKGDGKAPK